MSLFPWIFMLINLHKRGLTWSSVIEIRSCQIDVQYNNARVNDLQIIAEKMNNTNSNLR